jgi:hypothetical protein
LEPHHTDAHVVVAPQTLEDGGALIAVIRSETERTVQIEPPPARRDRTYIDAQTGERIDAGAPVRLTSPPCSPLSCCQTVLRRGVDGASRVAERYNSRG